jgi:hypothetical protein
MRVRRPIFRFLRLPRGPRGLLRAHSENRRSWYYWVKAVSPYKKTAWQLPGQQTGSLSRILPVGCVSYRRCFSGAAPGPIVRRQLRFRRLEPARARIQLQEFSKNQFGS